MKFLSKLSLFAVVTAIALCAVSPDFASWLHNHITVAGVTLCAFNATALNAYVKRTYDPKYIDSSMTSRIDKTLKDIGRDTDGGGENFTWLADADDSFSGSADFTIVQAAAAANDNTVGSKFLSDWNNYSAVAQITADIIGKTRNNDGAWQQAVDVAMKKTINGIAHGNAVLWQGKGWGEVSTIASVSGSTFVPGIRSDITKYVKGMPLHFSLTLHADTLRSTTVVYVTKVSYTPGAELVTLSAALASVSAVNGDTAFIAGCRQNSATPARIALIGMGAWWPNQNSGQDLTDATITTLLTVDRSSNSRLYGTFVDATSGGSALSALIDGVQEAVTVGGVEKLECYCSKTVFSGIAKDLQASVQYVDNPGSKTVGTSKLRVFSDGDVEAFLQVSRTMNDNQIWGYAPKQVRLKSIGGAPHIDNEDGVGPMLRMASSQGYEARWFQQAIYQVKNPTIGLRVQLV